MTMIRCNLVDVQNSMGYKKGNRQCKYKDNSIWVLQKHFTTIQTLPTLQARSETSGKSTSLLLPSDLWTTPIYHFAIDFINLFFLSTSPFLDLHVLYSNLFQLILEQIYTTDQRHKISIINLTSCRED